MSEVKRSILIINPNTTQAMTNALKPLVDALHDSQTQFDYFTAPSGVRSIKDEDDAAVSARTCLPVLKQKLTDYDAFLVCCYSQHPLVSQLRDNVYNLGAQGTGKVVTGIFEASIATCLQLLDLNDRFGIVSTGKQWETLLDAAVTDLVGSNASTRYVGTATTGLDASELHSTPADEVRRRMQDATKSLLRSGARAICLGCAGMAGLDRVVREACVEALGEERGSAIKIVDGVVSGVCFLDGALRARY